MFEDNLEFLEPVMNVFAAVVIFSLGITICVGCIMLAFKVCGRFNAFVREKAEKTINKWARRIDNVVVRIGERIGHFVKEAIEKSKTGIPVDMRPKMAGDWFCPDGADMTISEHNGYYKVKFSGVGIPAEIIPQEFILRDIQGWLHDDNVYCAEGRDVLAMAISNDGNEIFVADLGRTFYRKCDIPRPKRETFDEAALDDFINANQSSENKDILTEVNEVVEELTLSEDVRKRLCKLAIKDVPANDVGFNINIIE